MKKMFLAVLGLHLLGFVGIYFLFPVTLFNLAVKAGRYYAGLARKSRLTIIRLFIWRGEKGKRYCYSMVLPPIRTTGYDSQST
jgi:lauroyl/myristoyl acyltransferase